MVPYRACLCSGYINELGVQYHLIGRLQFPLELRGSFRHKREFVQKAKLPTRVAAAAPQLAFMREKQRMTPPSSNLRHTNMLELRNLIGVSIQLKHNLGQRTATGDGKKAVAATSEDAEQVVYAPSL